MFFNINYILANVSEILLPKNSFITKSDTKNLIIENASIAEDGILLRKGIESSSYISLENIKEGDLKSFSLELNIPNPKLRFPECWDLNLFVTEDELPYKTKEDEKGSVFKNIPSNFHGIHITTTFKGTRILITVGYNKSDNNYTDIDYIVQDNIAPERFVNINLFKFKYIFTPENIKIEIYNEETNEIVYDKLRFTEENVFGKIEVYKHVTMTNTFFKIPSERNLKISNIKYYKRLELKDYDKFNVQTKPLNTMKRDISDINHESEEIQFLISNLEHFMFYLKLMLGETDGTTLNNKILNLRRIVSNNSTSINQLIDITEDLKNKTKQNSLSNLNKKLSDLESKIIRVERLLIDSNLRISNIKESHWLGVKTIIIFALTLFIIYLLLNLLYDKLFRKKLDKIE